MTTIINTPPRADSGDSNGGWVVAIILLLATAGVGAYLWTQRGANTPPAANDTNVNVTIPAPGGGSSNSPSPSY